MELLVIGILSALGGMGAAFLWGRRNKQESPLLPQFFPADSLREANLPDAQAGETRMCWQKATENYQAIQELLQTLHETRLVAILMHIQQDTEKIFQYLQHHPERILTARKLFDIYQTKTLELAQNYQELEATGMRTQRVHRAKARILDTLYSFSDVYQAEFQKIMDNQLSNIDAELTVMQNAMESDGIRLKLAPETMEPAGTGKKKKKKHFLQEMLPQENRYTPIRFHPSDTPVPFDAFQDAVPAVYRDEELYYAVKREKTINGMLAILLGDFGVHKFYQGKIGQGILYAAFSWSGVPALIGIFEGIRYFLMDTETFYESYYRAS